MGARARAKAREAETNARMGVSRPSLRDDVPDTWFDDGEAAPRPGRGGPTGPIGERSPGARERTQRVAAVQSSVPMMSDSSMYTVMSGPKMSAQMGGMPFERSLPGGARATSAPARAALELGQKALSGLVILGVLIVLAVPVMFGLSRISALTPKGQSLQAAATRVPPAQAPSGFTSFVGDTYSVAYPSAWSHGSKTLAMSQGDVQADVFDDGHGVQALIAIGQPLPTNQLQMVVDDIAQRYFPPNLPQAMGAEGPHAYGGVTWASGDFTVATGSLGSQTVYVLRVLAANFGARTVIIVLQAKQADFASADGASFGPLLQSFRFG